MKLQKELRKFFTTQTGIVAVYLFGSHAKGRASVISDVDVAVLFGRTVSPKRYFDRSLKISCQLMQILNRDQVDVIVLNTAKPVLKNQIYKYGVLVFCRNLVDSIRFKAKAIMEYLDMIPLRHMCEMAIKRRALHYGR